VLLASGFGMPVDKIPNRIKDIRNGARIKYRTLCVQTTPTSSCTEKDWIPSTIVTVG
jgi:hypothetical protein